MRLVLIGPPGAGKGTQAEFIIEEFSIPHISTGDILRENVKRGSDLGKTAKKYMEAGDLVPDDLIFTMIEERFEKSDCQKGFLLDGFPRNVLQAEGLNKTLSKMSVNLDLVIHIKADSEELVKRAVGRRICRQCSAGYHVDFKPSSAGEECEKCGGELYQRPDDNESTVRDRINVYEKSTLPLIEFYEKEKKLFTVDGNLPLKKVSANIIGKLYDLY